jgi:GxxExxY protein
MDCVVDEDAVAAQIVDAAIAIHRALGPGLLESAYIAALEVELVDRGLQFVREAPIQARYRSRPLGVVYRADMIVENKVLIEAKSVRAIEEIHTAQLLSYLRLGNFRLGLLLNFNVPIMKRGIKRIANNP